MARQQTRRLEGARVPQPEREAVAATVSAAPVARATVVSENPEVEGLIKGLSALNPALNARWEEQYRRDLTAGRDAARAGMAREEAEQKSRGFIEGYLEGSGEAAAIADIQELQGRYATEHSKEDGDVDAFLTKFYQEKMKGSTDEHFNRGYNRIFAEGAQKLRAEHTENVAKAIVDTNRANAQLRIDYMIDRAIRDGKELDGSLLAQITAIGVEHRLTGPERDEALFLALAKHSAEGRPDVWAITKLPRKDVATGATLPPLYANPAWKDKIDRAEAQARSTADANAERAYRLAERDRRDRQQERLTAVYDLIQAGDVDGARRELNRLSQDRALFPRMDELATAHRLVNQIQLDFEKPGSAAAFNQWLVRIYSGEATFQSIANAHDLDPKQKPQLLSQLRSHLNMLRAEANDKRRTDAELINARFRDPQVKQALENVRALLRVERGFMESVLPEHRAAGVEIATAETELINWIVSNPQAPASEVQERSRMIVERVKKLREMEGPDKRLKRLGVPFRSFSELQSAIERGEVDPLSAAHYGAVLDSVLQEKPATPTIR